MMNIYDNCNESFEGIGLMHSFYNIGNVIIHIESWLPPPQYRD